MIESNTLRAATARSGAARRTARNSSALARSQATSCGRSVPIHWRNAAVSASSTTSFTKAEVSA